MRSARTPLVPGRPASFTRSFSVTTISAPAAAAARSRSVTASYGQWSGNAIARTTEAPAASRSAANAAGRAIPAAATTRRPASCASGSSRQRPSVATTSAVGTNRPRNAGGNRGPRREGTGAADGEDRLGARERGRRLAQGPRRQQPRGKPRFGDEHEVGVARERAVLKAVVEDDRVDTEALDGERRRVDPPLAGHHGARKPPREQHRLVAALRGTDARHA